MVDVNLQQPFCFIIPGLNNSGPEHWQTLWEERRDDCSRVEMGSWAFPVRNAWVSRIEQAFVWTERPIVFVAHSLGCHALAWWAQLSAASGDISRVKGALLVAPPEVDSRFVGRPLRTFAPSASAALPFPSILVASRDDPFAHPRRSRRLAQKWGSTFLDIGDLGHINADSGIGDWPDGEALLDSLLDGATARRDSPRPGDQSEERAAIR